MPVKAGVNDSIPIGIFEDSNWLGSSMPTFISTLQANGLDSMMFTNFQNVRDEPLLNQTDVAGINVYGGPNGNLAQSWYSNVGVTVDQTTADSIAQPLIQAVDSHTSLKGYYMVDEPTNSVIKKNDLMFTAARKYTSKPLFNVLIGVDRGPIHMDITQPDINVVDVYPYATANAACETTMRGFGYSFDMVDYIRMMNQNRPDGTPWWAILQTHNFSGLRQPTAAEIRQESWLSIGEGATGLFYFIYTSQQGWTGLKDRPADMNEIATIASRVRTLEPYLLAIKKIDDRFTAIAPSSAYVSTFRNPSTGDIYALFVNRTCSQQYVRLGSSSYSGTLTNIETNVAYSVNDIISLEAGDAAFFKLASSSTLSPTPTITQFPNRVQNPSFETAGGTGGANWGVTFSGASRTTAEHNSGLAALSVLRTGGTSFYTEQGLTLQPNTWYTMSSYVKSGVKSYAPPRIRWNVITPSVSSFYNSMITNSSSWRRSYTLFKTPATVTTGRFDITYESTPIGEQSYFDDISICEGMSPDCIPYSFYSSAAVPSPTPTIIFSAGNIVGSSSSPRPPLPPSCNDISPGGPPILFQIDRIGSEAVMYFTPGGAPFSEYVIAYGEGDKTEEYGTKLPSSADDGAVTLRIGYLKPQQQYSFKVRTGNGCNPGSWSNIVKVSTAKASYFKEN